MKEKVTLKGLVEAYNAMLKRILVDFTLFRQVFRELNCVLFQLESQLGGDFASIRKKVIYGSPSTSYTTILF